MFFYRIKKQAPVCIDDIGCVSDPRGENFGHVIHEALRAGLPLIISDKTPWQQLEEKGVGWALPLNNPGAFAKRIELVASWTPPDYYRAAKDARSLAASVADAPDVIDANRRLFLDAIKRHAPR